MSALEHFVSHRQTELGLLSEPKYMLLFMESYKYLSKFDILLFCENGDVSQVKTTCAYITAESTELCLKSAPL